MNPDGSNQGVQQRVLSPEFIEAMLIAARWLTKYIRDSKFPAAFSKSYIGEPAVDYFSHRLTERFVRGKWTRHKNEKMSTFLIRILKSDLSHHLRKWRTDGMPGLQIISPIKEEQAAYAKWVDSEILKELEDRNMLRNISYPFAEAAVEGDPEARKFLNAVKETDDYRAITKRMKMTKDAVMEVEKRMIGKVKACILFAETEGEPEVKKYVKAVKDGLDEHDIAKRMKMTEAAVEKVKERLIELARSYAMATK